MWKSLEEDKNLWTHTHTQTRTHEANFITTYCFSAKKAETRLKKEVTQDSGSIDVPHNCKSIYIQVLLRTKLTTVYAHFSS